jgi:hypothetical protein
MEVNGELHAPVASYMGEGPLRGWVTRCEIAKNLFPPPQEIEPMSSGPQPASLLSELSRSLDKVNKQPELLAGYVITNCGYRSDMLSIANSYCKSSKQLKTVYYCMSLDDGRMTETCCGSNIRAGEELLR